MPNEPTTHRLSVVVSLFPNVDRVLCRHVFMGSTQETVDSMFFIPTRSNIGTFESFQALARNERLFHR